MIIRKAEREDLKNCEELFAIPELKMPSGEYLKAEYLECYLDSNYFLVAEEDDVFIGAIIGEELKGGGVLVWELAVKENYRRKGIGANLLSKLEENAKNNGRHWIILYGAANNDKTLKFYEKFGYNRGTLNYEFAKDL